MGHMTILRTLAQPVRFLHAVFTGLITGKQKAIGIGTVNMVLLRDLHGNRAQWPTMQLQLVRICRMLNELPNLKGSYHGL